MPLPPHLAFQVAISLSPHPSGILSASGAAGGPSLSPPAHGPSPYAVDSGSSGQSFSLQVVNMWPVDLKISVQKEEQSPVQRRGVQEPQ